MKKIVDHLYPIVCWYFLWVGFTFTILYAITYFSPMEHRVTYYSVEPLKQENFIGDDFYMVSNREVKRDVYLEWLDTMRCNMDDEYVRVVDYVSYGLQQKKERSTSTWKYNAILPQKPTVCYMVSTITAHLDRWIHKQQQVTSWPFYFIRPNAGTMAVQTF
jgi:hypothetical protein